MKIKKEKLPRHRSLEDYPVRRIKIDTMYFRNKMLL